MKYSLSDTCTMVPGFAFKSKDFTANGFPVIKITHINPPSVTMDNLSHVDVSKYNSDRLEKFLVKKGDFVFAMTGATIGKIGKVNSDSAYINQRVLTFKAKEEIIDKNYLYYALSTSSFHDYVISHVDSESAQPNISATTLGKYEIDLPDLETQKKIVRILSALDQKIELNNQQSKNLFELGRQLYMEKFENNEAVDKVELGNFFPVITGKKDANASSENGKYPFFTCSKTISGIDDYVFDSSAILLAGNGDFNVKFYRGKFDAYQRTYVLIPNNPEYLGFLYWAISYNLPKITANYRGSVIRFITKGSIESFKVPFVDNKYIPAFMKYLEKIEKNNQQNEVLVDLRDALLPKLMSGEINLNEITINE